MACDDTLTLYLKSIPIGDFRHTIMIDSIDSSIDMRMVMRVRSPGGSGRVVQGARLFEERSYDFDGSLRSARQTMESATGTSRWDLRGDGSGGWRLTVNAGGVDNSRSITDIGENCLATCAIRAGMLDRTISVGDTWHDTVFDLTSASPRAVRITCTAIPPAPDRGRWRFTEYDAGLERTSTVEFDPGGRLLYEELEGMMEARHSSLRTRKTAPPAEELEISELLRIPAAPPRSRTVPVCLDIDGDIALDTSVRGYYRRHGTGWRVTPLPDPCADSPAPSPPDLLGKKPHLIPYTRPTVTIQSSHERIIACAEKAVPGESSPCGIIDGCNGWVYRNIEKQGTITFSSALETLDALRGDCGEHAVLLAAMLRARDIAARVVLGLVYLPEKKGFYYHAWVTAYAGSWVFADPALGRFPAGFGYVPLVIDDTGENALALAKSMNRLKIRWCEVR